MLFGISWLVWHAVIITLQKYFMHNFWLVPQQLNDKYDNYGLQIKYFKLREIFEEPLLYFFDSNACNHFWVKLYSVNVRLVLHDKDTLAAI